MPKGEYLQYGGQAIIEGVMMRSPNYFSVACRAPNGEIVHQTEAVEKTWLGRQRWLKLPILRGSLGILDQLILGNRALRFASNVQMDEKYAKPSDIELATEKMTEEGDPQAAPAVIVKSDGKRMQDAVVMGAVILGLVIGLVLFKLTPNLISAWAGNKLGLQHDWQINLITESLVITFFLSYIWLIGQMKEIKRVFEYHGAEHKAINAMEAGEPLDVPHCLKQTRLHPRCGTSFAIIVLIVSLFCFTFLPRPHIQPALLQGFVRFLMEIPVLLLIAGVSYELIRFAGKFRTEKIVMAMFWPGLMSQYLTTREPDESQTEVALVALKEVIAAEESGAIAA